MYSGFMINTWIAASAVAVVAGVVGFFVVMRGSAFVAHAVPHGAFGGAAAAVLLGVNTLLGLAVFAVGGALGIGWLGRRGRHDVVTALTLVSLLGLGALFLSLSSSYAPEVYSLLFGEVLGVASADLLPIVGLAVLCVGAVLVLYRPLLLTSLVPDVAAARGVGAVRMELAFLLVVAAATTLTVPVVGAFLIYSLLIAPAGAARSLTSNPLRALVLSVVIAVLLVWIAIVASYLLNWPIGFFVGTLGVVCFAVSRGVAWLLVRARRPGRQDARRPPRLERPQATGPLA